MIELAIARKLAAVTAAMEKEITASAERIAIGAAYLAPVDTGMLRDSIRSRVVAYLAPGMFSAEALADTEYAAFLEFGTSKMDAQPYMIPSLEIERELLVASFAALMALALKA